MADSDVPGLTALTGSGSATGDLVHVVDVSDTTFAADGTDKKMTLAELATAITTHGALATDAEVAAGYQPLDSDLTAIAALTTTAFGRAFLALADASAARTAIGTVIGTDVQAYDADLAAIAALAPTNDDVVQRKAGAWTNRTIAQLLSDLAAAGTTFQPLDSDLTAIAALTTTSFGRGLLALADAAAARSSLDVPSNAEAVLDSLFDANTILAANSDNTPAAVTVAEQTLVGRITSGNITALSAAQVRTLLDVPTNAEAVLDTLYDAQTVVAAVSDNTPTAITLTEETVLGRITGGNVSAINPSSVVQTIRTSTANMTLVIADAGKILQFNKGTAGTVTVPSSSSVNFPVGTRVDFVQLGAGAATLTPGSGVTISASTQLTLVTNGQYSGGTMYKRGANLWLAFGDLVPG